MDGNATVLGGNADPSYSFALWNLVIRPPRARYHTWQLGPNEFTINGTRAIRRDYKLQAKTGGSLACSHFFPRGDWGDREQLRKCPVVVYLHGNSSNRLEAVSILGPLLVQGISLFCFDSAGCGQSDGEYVSLGWHERDDLATVLEHLRRSPFCGPIGLWGRSMGAVTVLLHADRDQSVGAICLDSPFVSLRQLVEDLAGSAHAICPLPYWLVVLAFAVIRMRVQALANFDIEDLAPLEHAKRSFVPAIFMHAEEDTFISPAHSRQLYEAYMGDKEFALIDGDHNSERSDQAVGRAVDFFRRALRVDEADPGIAAHVAAVGAGPRPMCGLTPPVQPECVEPLAAPQPTFTQRLSCIKPTLQPRVEVEVEDLELPQLLRIDFSPNWQSVMEDMLMEVGWMSEKCKKRLLVTDRDGKPVKLFSSQSGKVPPPGCFPLTIELLAVSTAAKAARRGGA